MSLAAFRLQEERGTAAGSTVGAVRRPIHRRSTDLRHNQTTSAEQARLFERFFRGSNAAGIDGIGLGLNIARHLARIQQGDLAVSSSPGEGTVFILWLPAADPEEASDVPT